MKRFFNVAVTIAMCMFAMAACSKITDDTISQDEKRPCKMVFEGSIAGYDSSVLRDGSATRAASSWQEGDKVYITFYKGTQIVTGEAQYSEADGWTINFDGDLTEGTNLKCEVRFFVNPTFSNAYTVNLNPHSEIYEDVAAKYNYSSGNLQVTASLVPKVGRIRFTGKAGDKIHITGIECYSNYAPATNTFSSTKELLTETVSNDGSTAYIYGFCAVDDRKVGIIGSDFAYTKYFAESIYKAGESGYMAIPTSNSHNGWKSGLYVTAGDVEFKMIPVTGFSGGFFLIGETEVTNAMYYMKSSTSNASYPMRDYYSVWINYISSITYATNLPFYIPSLAEWQYAFIGGLYSQGYTYSGSNNPGDVAWYAANSGNSFHPVKQLAPNELGIYDMSGNVTEWVSDYRTSGSYTYYQYCGGNYTSSETAITVDSITEIKYGEYYSGLRLALKFD